MRVKAYVLRDIQKAVSVPLNTLGYRDFVSEPDWHRNLISFTSILYHPGRNSVVCGLTSFDTDIMYEFNLTANAFHSLNYKNVSEQFEIKIHRSLALDRKGRIYGATACLHREDQRHNGTGGRIFCFDFATRSYDFLGVPIPPDYIQTITLDEERGLIYGCTYPVFNFFVFDIKRRALRYQHYVGSIPHIMAIDDQGCVWSTWNNRTHNLFKYDPEQNKIIFFDHSLPSAKSAANLMYPGAGPIDMMLNGGDGYIYVGEASGALLRIEPNTACVEYLGKPCPQVRLPALEVGPDGLLYGVAGFEGECHIFAYDREKRSFKDFGLIADSDNGKRCFIPHDMCITPDGRIFIGETDTRERAGYLWECSI